MCIEAWDRDCLKVFTGNVCIMNFKKSGFDSVKEKPIPLIYEGITLDCGYRIDILVENKVVIEIKSIESIDTGSSGPNSDLSKSWQL